MNTIHKDDLDRMIKLNQVEAFTPGQLKLYAEQANDEIVKSEEGKEDVYAEIAEEIRSFTPYTVISADHENHIEKSIMMLRPAQIEWDEQGGDIEKSRTGTYLNTPENRKKGRVGQRFGENDIEKGGKAANIGDIHVWDGKKFKKQANGKWLEVSDDRHKMTKEEHKKEISDYTHNLKQRYFLYSKRMRMVKEHEEASSKLSDKEHSDEEVGLGGNKFKIGDKVKLEDGYDKQGKPVIREYTISKPGMRNSSDRLKEGEYYLTSPGTIGFDVTEKWLSENQK